MANSCTYHSFKGSSDFVAGEDPCYLTIRTTGPFTVFRIDENSDRILIGPDSDSDRVFWLFLKPHESIFIKVAKTVAVFVDESHLPNPAEVVSSESLVEIIPVEEMSAIDRLRSEMLSSISALAAEREHGTFEDENDFEDDYDDGDAPLSPHEYALMHDEYLAAQQYAAQQDPAQQDAAQSDAAQQQQDTAQQSSASPKDETVTPGNADDKVGNSDSRVTN